MPSCPPRAPSACERELGLSAESAQQLAFRAELGDYFEARARRRDVEPPPPAQTLANWVTGELARAARRTARTRAASRVQPGRARRARRAWSPPSGSASAPARQVLDRLVADGGEPAGDRRGRGPRGDRTAGEELAAIVAAALAGQRRRRRARARRQRQGDRPDRRPRDARDQGPRRRRRGLAADPRAARRLSPQRRAARCLRASRSAPPFMTRAGCTRHILDGGPKASGARHANMLAHEPFGSKHKRFTSSAVHPAARGDGGCSAQPDHVSVATSSRVSGTAAGRRRAPVSDVDSASARMSGELPHR